MNVQTTIGTLMQIPRVSAVASKTVLPIILFDFCAQFLSKAKPPGFHFPRHSKPTFLKPLNLLAIYDTNPANRNLAAAAENLLNVPLSLAEICKEITFELSAKASR
jgi:hypothetical protein